MEYNTDIKSGERKKTLLVKHWIIKASWNNKNVYIKFSAHYASL